MDWQRDENLDAWIATANQRRRYQAAAFALRRLRAPLLRIEMPEEWGVPVPLVEALFEAVAQGPGARVTELVGELRATPLFESETEPELAELAQLEAIDGLSSLAYEQHDLDEATSERIISKARSMAHYVDELAADSLTEDPLEQAHEAYLSSRDGEVLAYGLGYFGSRNLEVEFTCRDELSGHDDSAPLATPAAAELIEACDRFGDELVVAIRRLAS